LTVKVTWEGAATLIGCIALALLPLPRHAQGLRVGLFSAMLGYLLFDTARRNHSGDGAGRAVPRAPVDLSSANEDDRLSAGDLLKDFSILRHLRRTGAVSDSEFEAKKVDILRRV
jgi:hypothetical protein